MVSGARRRVFQGFWPEQSENLVDRSYLVGASMFRLPFLRCPRWRKRAVTARLTCPAAGRSGSRPAEPFGEFADFEPAHLVFESAQGDAEVSRGGGDIPFAAFERAQDEVSLERIASGLEQVFSPTASDEMRAS